MKDTSMPPNYQYIKLKQKQIYLELKNFKTNLAPNIPSVLSPIPHVREMPESVSAVAYRASYKTQRKTVVNPNFVVEPSAWATSSVQIYSSIPFYHSPLSRAGSGDVKSRLTRPTRRLWVEPTEFCGPIQRPDPCNSVVYVRTCRADLEAAAEEGSESSEMPSEVKELQEDEDREAGRDRDRLVSALILGKYEGKPFDHSFPVECRPSAWPMVGGIKGELYENSRKFMKIHAQQAQAQREYFEGI